MQMERQNNGKMIDFVEGVPETITLQPGQVIVKRLIRIVVDHDKCFVMYRQLCSTLELPIVVDPAVAKCSTSRLLLVLTGLDL